MTKKKMSKTAKVNKQLIKKDMPIIEIVEKYPIAIDVFQDYGLHCIGCHFSVFETIEQGSRAHGIPDKDIDKMIEEANKLVLKYQ